MNGVNGNHRIRNASSLPRILCRHTLPTRTRSTAVGWRRTVSDVREYLPYALLRSYGSTASLTPSVSKGSLQQSISANMNVFEFLFLLLILLPICGPFLLGLIIILAMILSD
jgi:hypothetical protein